MSPICKNNTANHLKLGQQLLGLTQRVILDYEIQTWALFNFKIVDDTHNKYRITMINYTDLYTATPL